jgi:hypothetical protein
VPLKRTPDTHYDCRQPNFKLNMRWRRELDSHRVVIKTKYWSLSSKGTLTKPTSIENRKVRPKNSP